MPNLPILDDGDSFERDPNASDTIASLWFAQVEAYDSLPRQRRSKDVYTFSPSKADACERELYYDMTGAPTDGDDQVPWENRRARNGNAYHAETQHHHTKMADVLRKRGRGDKVSFEVVTTEIDGEATFSVEIGGKKRVVRIKGRADVVARYVGETIPGVIKHGEFVLVDYKSKDKQSGVDSVKRRGVPSYTTAQMAAYSLLRFTSKDGTLVFDKLAKTILHYESFQKPKNGVKESKDVFTTTVEASVEDGHALVRRFARVVEAVEEGTIPAPDRSKCLFCVFQKQCALDGNGEAKEDA